MKNSYLRILISAALFSLLSGIVVAIIGLIFGWKTSTQFSDGFFWVGAILISSGFMSFVGRLNQPITPYGQSAYYVEKAERADQWVADISKGHNILIFLGLSGLLLFGLSGLAILVGKLF